MQRGKLRHVFTFEAVSEGTRLTQEGRREPDLLGRLMWPVMSRLLRLRFRVIASEVSRYVESGATTEVKGMQSSNVG